jgi:hypothetical protein
MAEATKNLPIRRRLKTASNQRVHNTFPYLGKRLAEGFISKGGQAKVKKLLPLVIVAFLPAVCLVVIKQTTCSAETGMEKMLPPVTAFDLNQNNTVTVSIVPVSSSVNVCNIFTVAIQLETVTQEVDAFDTYVDFETDYLQAKEIVSANTFELDFVKEINNTNGVVRYAGGSIYSCPSGTFDAAYIIFEATCKAETTLTFRDTLVCSKGITFPLHITSGTVEVLPNHPPSVTVNITPASPTANDDLTLNYEYYDLDGDPEGSTFIRWTRDSQLQSAFNDQKAVPSNITLPCEHWCVAVTPHDECEYGDAVEQCVDIGTCNKPPSALNVTISPSDPSAPEATIRHTALAEQVGLTVTYTYTDANNDTENKSLLQIRWYRNGKLQPAFNDQPTVPLDEIHPGETWHVTVRLHDGTEYGLPVQSNPVVVANANTGNHIPTVLTATIEPAEPESSDDLELTYIYTDTDGDPEGVSLLRWYRNGMLQPSYNGTTTIPAEYTLPGDEWYATVRPHDGEDYGLPIKTNVVQVSEPTVNTEPEIVDAYIDPAEPGDDDHLRLHYTYVDVDGDSEGDTLILWYKIKMDQIVLQEDYINLSVVPSNATKDGERWFAKIVPHDGKAYGIVVAAHSVTIGEEESNIPPKALNVYLSPASPCPDDSLELNYDYYDANEHPQGETEIRWTIYGNPGGYEDRTIIPAFATAVGQTWCATVTPHDGFDYGESVESNCVTITVDCDNTSPETQDAYIEPERPRSDQNLLLHYTFFDLDNDSQEDTQIHWYRDDDRQEEFDGWTFIPAEETEPGQQWYATITPHDGIENGTPITTPIVTINYPPQVTVGVELQLLHERQVLALTYDYYDADGDPETLSRIHWYCNDKHRSEYDGEIIVPANDTSVGERWYVKMAVHDGVEYGEEAKSNVLTIGKAHYLVYLPVVTRDYPPDSLTLISPAGGESWKTNSAQTIRWRTTGSVPYVSLCYTDNGFFTCDPIAVEIPNEGSYEWVVPNTPISPCAQMKIISVDDPLTVQDVSSCFIITRSSDPPSLILNAPTGGETLPMGEPYQIRWYRTGDVPKVTLTYSTDNFDTEHIIASEIPNTGSYTWTVPIDPTFFAQVRVVSGTISDTSGYFAIGCDKSKYWEENDTQSQACPLKFDETCNAYPDDLDDWYYVFLDQTSSLHVEVTNYVACGQVVVYPYNPNKTPRRDDPLANDGRGHKKMELPNEILPHALDHLKGQPMSSGLPPGRYLIRVYSSDDCTTSQLYHLTTTYEPIEH